MSLENLGFHRDSIPNLMIYFFSLPRSLRYVLNETTVCNGCLVCKQSHPDVKAIQEPGICRTCTLSLTHKSSLSRCELMTSNVKYVHVLQNLSMFSGCKTGTQIWRHSQTLKEEPIIYYGKQDPAFLVRIQDFCRTISPSPPLSATLGERTLLPIYPSLILCCFVSDSMKLLIICCVLTLGGRVLCD